MAQFMVQGGGLNQDEALDIASDAAGNVYVTGYFGSTLSFAGGISIGSSGLSDIFLLKANSSGQVQWAVKAGSAGDERATAVCVDNAGNVYITGYFQGTANFSGTSVTSAGLQDVFVAKYNNAGALQWVRRAGGTGADISSGIAVDNAGNVAVTGEFRNTADFGSVTLVADATDAFVCKYDASGTVLWAKKGAGPDNSRGLDIAVDAAGNLYAMGQFTNDITFDNLQVNNIFNAIYLVKFNAAGAEQWFRKAGGATNNIAYSIDVDASANVYMTGDFTGNLVFFPNTGAPLTNPYPNRIFLAKYNTGGTLQWAKANGSVGEVSSRKVTVGNAGEVYLGGWFKCKFSEYADEYGQGNFNSVGFKDGFVARFDGSGTRLWSRNFGGWQDDYVTGVAPGATADMPYVSAVYLDNLFVPYDQNANYQYDTDHVRDTVAMGAMVYCGSNTFNRYLYAPPVGGADLAFGNLVNPNRLPYDYYFRTGGCVHTPIKVCISDLGLPLTCPDSLHLCGSGWLFAVSNTTQFGPQFTYNWSNGLTSDSILVGTSGSYIVTQSSADGCFVTRDTIPVRIDPLPPVPPITDNVVINNHAVTTQTIKICQPQTVRLTGSTLGMPNYQWTGGNPHDSVIVVSQVGYNVLTFTVTNQFGCSRTNRVQVDVLPPLPPLDPHIFCYSDPDMNDTVSFCNAGYLQFGFYDSLSDQPLNCNLFSVSAEITVNNGSPSSPVLCMDAGPALYALAVDSAGWYHVRVTMRQYNVCDTIEYVTDDSIYVQLYPLPNANLTLTGPDYICPNDTVFITASGSAGFTWTGDISFFVDSLTAAMTGPGMVQISAIVVDTVTGCQNMASAQHTVTAIPTPVLVTNPATAIICPNDSLQLTLTNPQYYSTFQWVGPQGTLTSSTPSLYVTDAGFYYCIATDQSGCSQQSNSIEISQYGTPYLMAGPSSMLCPGADTVFVYVVTNPGSTIQWNSPLSGSDSLMAITHPGNYTVQVTSCGVTTVAQIQITQSNLDVHVTPTGHLTFCEGDSVLLHAQGTGAISYDWSPGTHQGQNYVVHHAGSYTVTVEDTAGCFKQSAPVVVNVTADNIPAPLAHDTLFCPPASLTLTASGAGTVYWFADQAGGAPIDSGNVFHTPVLTQATIYYVMTGSGGCKSPLKAISLGEANCNHITPPNVFTPNGDGINDFISFDIKGLTCFYAEIRNRWGVKIYESKNPALFWNGNVLSTNQPAVDGTYFYIIEYCPQNGDKQTLKGYITLLK